MHDVPREPILFASGLLADHRREIALTSATFGLDLVCGLVTCGFVLCD